MRNAVLFAPVLEDLLLPMSLESADLLPELDQTLLVLPDGALQLQHLLHLVGQQRFVSAPRGLVSVLLNVLLLFGKFSDTFFFLISMLLHALSHGVVRHKGEAFLEFVKKLHALDVVVVGELRHGVAVLAVHPVDMVGGWFVGVQLAATSSMSTISSARFRIAICF